MVTGAGITGAGTKKLVGAIMPRKTDYDRDKKSSNPRANIDTNGLSMEQALKDTNVGKHVSNLADLYTGKQNYSDFTSRFNGYTDGWFSTLANGLPFISNLHNALLGRDSAKDYLENNGLGWEDMEGYNDVKLLGRTSQAVGSLARQSGSYLSNIGNDLGKLYSGQTTSINPRNGYSSRMMESW